MQSDNTKNCYKKHGNTAILDQLRTVSLNNEGNTTSLFKPVYGIQTISLAEKVV